MILKAISSSDEYCGSSFTNKSAEKVVKKSDSNLSSTSSSGASFNSNWCNSIYYPHFKWKEKNERIFQPTKVVTEQSPFKADNKCNNRPPRDDYPNIWSSYLNRSSKLGFNFF